MTWITFVTGPSRLPLTSPVRPAPLPPPGQDQVRGHCEARVARPDTLKCVSVDASAPRTVRSEVVLDHGEPIRAHVVGREDQMRGYVMGAAIRALCGVVFVPSRDPSRYPTCEECRVLLRGLT